MIIVSMICIASNFVRRKLQLKIETHTLQKTKITK